MRRLLLHFSVVLITLCASWPASTQAQPGGPTLSADLLAPRARGERVRVIVQGAEPALGSLRSRLRGLLRRDLGSGLAPDLSADEPGWLSEHDTHVDISIPPEGR